MARSGFATQHLRSFIERIERLEEEKKALVDDIREVYVEAKGTGFDTRVMREVVRLRKMETADRREREALLDHYMTALGMRSDVPPAVRARVETLIEADDAAQAEGFA